MGLSLPEPGEIHTLAGFKAALELLRAGRSFKDLDNAVSGRLPKTTLSDLFNSRKGLPSEATLEVFLCACSVPQEQQSTWLAARRRVRDSSDPRADGLIRVSQADPRRLGVHAAIEVPGAMGDLPTYVERDTDTSASGVRALISRAAEKQHGGLILLVGGSSVGKTRSAFEAVRVLLGDWWLLHPANVAQIRSVAQDPPTRLVVWLDELQRYIDCDDPLEAGIIHDLLNKGAILVATIWPGRREIYAALPQAGQADPHAAARELLRLADTVDIDDSFSLAERKRAMNAAMQGDVRIQLALQTSDYGLTQTIAAAPELMRRWRQASPYAVAILTAAIDSTRLGVSPPIMTALLRQAAPGYCDLRQRAKAPHNWFENAMEYLTEELHGAAAALTPIAHPTGGMGQVAGYEVADYVQQQVAQQRHLSKVPEECWQAIADHVTEPADQVRVGQAAALRTLHGYAELLYRKAAQAGSGEAAGRLAHLLTDQGRDDEAVQTLSGRVDAGDQSAAAQLDELLYTLGREDEAVLIWRKHAVAGDPHAHGRLIEMLYRLERVEELREHANAKDAQAADRLAELLSRKGDEDELRERADAGDRPAAIRLAELLTKRGREAETLSYWRSRADAGDQYAVSRTAELLTKMTRDIEALEYWRERADAGDRGAADRLSELLAGLRRTEELRKRADAGDRHAAMHLAVLLSNLGNIEELRNRANIGDPYAASQLSEMLTKLGLRGELRERADDGDRHAARRLVELLAEEGHEKELRERAGVGDRYSADMLAELMLNMGRDAEALAYLRERAAGGDWRAAGRATKLLTNLGWEGETLSYWRECAQAGDRHAGVRLTELLSWRKNEKELRVRARAGEQHAAVQLAELLANLGRVKALRERADTGDSAAVERLAALLFRLGIEDELRRRADAGDWHASGRLAELLAGAGRLEELRERAEAGDRRAGELLLTVNRKRVRS
ncbi:hypothetical protein ACIBG7_26630 [Nonomuraea sp. NPDC050328]|uniref:hypothetical protein n=1 Tax=Nonomuraea sp. NPDC050328 TaxID=3364361 RepID=UPI0037BD3239